VTPRDWQDDYDEVVRDGSDYCGRNNDCGFMTRLFMTICVTFHMIYLTTLPVAQNLYHQLVRESVNNERETALMEAPLLSFGASSRRSHGGNE
jgi:hypothetical protein